MSKEVGLTVVSFDRSRFKLFTLRFLNKSMQTPSCESHKTGIKLDSKPYMYYLNTMIVCKHGINIGSSYIFYIILFSEPAVL
jgi:hypothetical protein